MTKNISMADEIESLLPGKDKHAADQNGWHGEHEVEMVNDDEEEEDYESSTDDNQFHKNEDEHDEDDVQEEKLSDDATMQDNSPIPLRHFSTAGIVDGTEQDKAIGCGEAGVAVKPLGSETNPVPEDVEQISFRKKRDQDCGRTLGELLALYDQEGQFQDDDEDDKDWEPFGAFTLQMKWFCTNCTMSNLEDSVYCDVCGEHKKSDILNQGFLASPFIPDEVPSYSKVPGDRSEEIENGLVTTLSPPTPSTTGESFTLMSRSEMHTAVGFDQRMLLHSEIQMKSHPHPERPDRLRAIAASLAAAGLFPGKCFPIPVREVTCQELEMIHSMEHVSAVELTSCRMSSYFTPDTYANKHSALAARLAAGLCADLATTIMRGQAQNGFALVRPPGHHAGVRDAMGFCLHNNAAIAVSASRSAGAKKVLIVDWDVHHGNGTQEIFESDQTVLYISLHRHEGGRFYPGSGAASEVGSSEGEGYSVNIPWKCGGVGDGDYIFAFQHAVLPIAEQFAPDLTIISAGFDAAKGDPLGRCEVTPDGFAQMAHMLSGPSKGKLLVILEGGYNLRSISTSATAVVKVLLGENPGPIPDNIQPSKAGLETLLEVLEIQLNYWPCLKEHYLKLRSQWESLYATNRRKVIRKRRIVGGPIWWKWGRKRAVYDHWFGRISLKKNL
eukprot:Gb_19579 [translate_table: standard]